MSIHGTFNQLAAARLHAAFMGVMLFVVCPLGAVRGVYVSGDQRFFMLPFHLYVAQDFPWKPTKLGGHDHQDPIFMD